MNLADFEDDFEDPKTEEDVQSRYFNTESVQEPSGITGKAPSYKVRKSLWC